MVVGLASALLPNGFGDSSWGGLFVRKIEPGPLFAAHTLSAILAGRIVSGALFLFAGRKLREGFFARYVLVAMAICCGGAILGVFLFGSIILPDEREPMSQGLEIRILGLFEGAYLGLALAGSLGMFGDRTAGRTVSR